MGLKPPTSNFWSRPTIHGIFSPRPTIHTFIVWIPSVTFLNCYQGYHFCDGFNLCRSCFTHPQGSEQSSIYIRFHLSSDYVLWIDYHQWLNFAAQVLHSNPWIDGNDVNLKIWRIFYRTTIGRLCCCLCHLFLPRDHPIQCSSIVAKKKNICGTSINLGIT